MTFPSGFIRRRTRWRPTVVNEGNLLSAVTFTSADARNLFDSAGLLDIDGAPAETARRSILGGNGYHWSDGSVTNSLLHNRDLSDAAWTNNGATQDAVGIDGVANKAWTFSGTDDASQAVTVSNDSNTHRPTWYLKKNGGVAILSAAFTGGTTTLDYIATVDTSDGSAVASGDAVAADITVDDVGDWYWVQVEAANNSTGNTTFTYDIDVSSGTFVYDMGGVFLNQTAPLHVFETAGSAVSVDAEDAILTLGSWFNNNALTILADIWRPVATGSGMIVELAAEGGNFMQLSITTAGAIRLRVDDEGDTQINTTGGSITGGTLQKVAFVFSDGDFSVHLNGSQIISGSGTMPTVDTMYIGRQRAGGVNLYGGFNKLTNLTTGLSVSEANSRTTL